MLAWRGTLGGTVAYDQHRRAWSWTRDEDKLLRDCAAAGNTMRAAAAKIKCTHGMIVHRVRVIGVRFQPRHFHTARWTQDEDDTLRRAAAAGETKASLGQRIDRGWDGVSRRARRLGIVFTNKSPRDAHWTEAALRDAKSWWLDGLSGGEIAKRLGPAFTRCSVIGKAHRKKWSRSTKTHATKTRSELIKRRLKERRQRRLKIRAPALSVPRSHPKPFLRNSGPPKPANFNAFTVLATDVARVTHEQLASNHCRWPAGNPEEVFKPLYCGRPRVPGLPYCHTHCLRAFNVISRFPRQTYPTPEVI
jgi:GcrA cell cycle regulator